jgi:hypothetical protein
MTDYDCGAGERVVVSAESSWCNRLISTIDGIQLKSGFCTLAMSLKTTGIQATDIEPAIPPPVTGWLLLLCLLLTLVYPATSVYRILKALPSFFDGHSPRFIFLLSAYCVVFLGLAVLGFIAGLKLWLVTPDAVRYARRWLWTYLFANFAYFGLWLVSAKHLSSLSVAEMGWYHVVGPIPSFALWYFYLENSKRVRATFPSP